MRAGSYCSRYLLLCEALESNREELAFPAFERLFHERGLPRVVRSDNGVPFASPHGLFQLSKLSIWWLCLRISIERIRPGLPQQNGRHERVHLTLKKEATCPAGTNILQQQAKFDAFLQEFNSCIKCHGAKSVFVAVQHLNAITAFRIPETDGFIV
jgi:transposase InsO family protein